MPILPNSLYYGDLELNAEYQSVARTVTQADLTTFAGFSGDFNPIHIDHEFAKTTPYRRPVVHGFAVFSIASGLGTQSPATRTVALLRVSGWTFTAPVFVGDTIHLLSRVHEKTLKGRGRRGEVVWHRRILNQDGRVVQEGYMVTLVECLTAARVGEGAGDD
jgi:acyl dehydratase